MSSYDFLRAHVSNDPAALEQLYFSYSSLPDGLESIRFSIGRRLCTVSKLLETLDVTTRRSDNICSLANLGKSKIRILKRWVAHPSNIALGSVLPVKASLFSEILRREADRLDSLELVRNEVRVTLKCFFCIYFFSFLCI